MGQVENNDAVDGYRHFISTAEWYSLRTPYTQYFTKNHAGNYLPLAHLLEVGTRHVGILDRHLSLTPPIADPVLDSLSLSVSLSFSLSLSSSLSVSLSLYLSLFSEAVSEIFLSFVPKVARRPTYKGHIAGLTSLPVDCCTVLGILVTLATLLPTASLGPDALMECLGVLQTFEEHMSINDSIPLLPHARVFCVQVQENLMPVPALKAALHELGLSWARPYLGRLRSPVCFRFGIKVQFRASPLNFGFRVRLRILSAISLRNFLSISVRFFLLGL